MKIGIDARSISHQYTGVANYILNVLTILGEIDLLNEYFLYSNRDFSMPVESDRWHKCIGQGITIRNGTLWVTVSLHRMLERDNIDVLWCPMQVTPLLKTCRTVLTVYDFVWHFFPETMSASNLLISRLFIPRSIKRADRIVCISKSTAADLARLFPGHAAVTEVVHLAANDYHPLGQEERVACVIQKYRLQGRYILNVGTVEPRKNLSGLLKAFKLLRSHHTTDYCLLIAGGSGWRNSSVYSTYRECGFMDDEVKFLGYVPDEDMPYLYAGAELFVFPSLYEGFGLPPLEAMACRKPVIGSATGGIPELINDGMNGFIFKVGSVDQLAEKINTLSRDPKARTVMGSNGRSMVEACYTWDIVADKYMSLFHGQ